MLIWLGLGALAACIAISVWLNIRRGRRLRRQFGPEYTRVLAQQGDREVTELELQQRLRRREALHISTLSEEARARYLTWLQTIDGAFEADPAAALTEADALVAVIARARGFPAESFEQIVGDISVDDPEAAQEYRAGHTLATRDDQPGGPSREQLRTALMHYRLLIQRLVGEPGGLVNSTSSAGDAE
ncbi:MAG: hypothetical protein ACTHNU_09130 [Gaiellales bacterium]